MYAAHFSAMRSPPFNLGAALGKFLDLNSNRKWYFVLWSEITINSSGQSRGERKQRERKVVYLILTLQVSQVHRTFSAVNQFEHYRRCVPFKVMGKVSSLFPLQLCQLGSPQIHRNLEVTSNTSNQLIRLLWKRSLCTETIVQNL